MAPDLAGVNGMIVKLKASDFKTPYMDCRARLDADRHPDDQEMRVWVEDTNVAGLLTQECMEDLLEIWACQGSDLEQAARDGR